MSSDPKEGGGKEGHNAANILQTQPNTIQCLQTDWKTTLTSQVLQDFMEDLNGSGLSTY